KEVASHERRVGKESVEVVTALEYIARVNFRHAEYDEAEAIYQRVIDVRRKLREDGGVLVTMGNLAAVTYGRGDYQRSEDLYKQVLAGWESWEKPKQTSWIARTLMHLGEVDNEKGDYAAAGQYLRRALSMVTTSDPHAIAVTIQDGYLNFTADLLTAL